MAPPKKGARLGGTGGGANPRVWCTLWRTWRLRRWRGLLHASKSNNPSFAWKNIYATMGLLLKGLRWRFDNGTSIGNFEDPWLPSDDSSFVQSDALSGLENMMACDLSNDDANLPSLPRRWQRPSDIWVKCNVDTVVSRDHGYTGLAAIIRDKHGEFIKGKTLCLSTCLDAAHAEVMAIREGGSPGGRGRGEESHPLVKQETLTLPYLKWVPRSVLEGARYDEGWLVSTVSMAI
ncbi:hypothetical protein J1N35_045410 [Gossypium stocksii]|uniref:RNase H type-1 domain-containing protein n=1 Tax=Gossypium stocksii TaxID=47602 RepID=A0A9D3UAY4_9ROSI|nr:hypothetical protein J1N35_045410 [Gossypium stocksii]